MKLFLNYNNLFIVIVLYIITIISSFEFTFPSAVRLNNGNIFVIEKSGIYIYDSTLSNLINTVYTFPDEDQIKTTEDLTRVVLKKKQRFILSLINYKTFFFNERGELLCRTIDKFITTETLDYYTLVPISYDSTINYCSYVIGFIDSNFHLKLNLGKLYCNEGKAFHYLSEFSSFKTQDPYNFPFQNKGLSCEKMIDYYYYNDYYLICFFVASKYFYGGFYSIKDTSIENVNKYDENLAWEENLKIKYIQSAKNYDENLALVCYVQEDNETYCNKFYIYKGNGIFYKRIRFTKECRNEYYAMKVTYLYNKNEVSFTCSGNDGSIQAAFFDEDLNTPSKAYHQFSFCESIYGYSILDFSDYYVISDVTCNGNKQPFTSLFDNNEQLVEQLDNDTIILEEPLLLEEEIEEELKIEEELEEEIEEELKEEIEEKLEEELKEEIEEKLEEELKEEIEEKLEEELKEEIEEELEEEIEKELEEEIEEKLEEELKEEIEEKLEEELKEEIEEELENEIEEELENEIEEKLEEEIEEEFESIIECKELEKCSKCGKESYINKLCLSCNTPKNYYPLNLFPNQQLLKESEYIECVNEYTKPNNFYFNQINQDYESCFETCATCKYGGDGIQNNCTTCDENYIKKPDYENSTECVPKCTYYYYYNNYDQYKCTSSLECPKEYILLVRNKSKCIDNCIYDDKYKYKYSGECLIQCPDGTTDNNDTYICRDINLNKCVLSENNYNYLDENIKDEEIEKFAGKYAKEFNYTDNHVSLFNSEFYTVALYKSPECISDLSLKMPKINFGECYKKVQNENKIEDSLVVSTIVKKIKDSNSYEIVSYELFDPKDGRKLPSEEICKDDVVEMEEDLENKLEESNVNMEDVVHLTRQNIDIFDLNSDFYTDICYHYVSNINKDVALKDRILIYFPNITLCQAGCKSIGINRTSLKVICECTINGHKDNILSNNILYQSQIGQLEEMLSNTNIKIIKCYKDIFIYKYFISNIGGFIILALIICQIIFTIIFYRRSLFKIKMYIFSITNQFFIFLCSSNNNNALPNNSLSIYEKVYSKKEEPPRRKIKSQTNLNKFNDQENARKNKRNVKTFLNQKGSLSNNEKSNPNDNTKSPQTFKLNLSSSNSINNSSEKNKNLKERRKRRRKTKLKSIQKKSVDNNQNLSNEYLASYKTANEKYNPNILFLNIKDDVKVNMDEYLNTEFDDMDYDDAIRKDKRTFCEYFCEKLKSGQIILNTFFYKEPLKPRSIKILLFILQIELYLFVNGLFFNEEYVSQIFHLKEDNFAQKFDRFIGNFFYASLVGVIVSYIIDFFFIEEKKVKGILKREKNNSLILKYEIVQIIKDISNRYFYFIIISFIISTFIWYHISCFNNIYSHMKIEWIVFSIIIIIGMQILSFLARFLETILRFWSFKCKSEKIYKISLLFS